MTTRFKPALLLAALALGAVAAIGGGATPAEADETSGCYGSSCTGLDPTICSDDAITIARMDVAQDTVGGNLEMRYSRTCNAAWARYSPYPERSGFWPLVGQGVVHMAPTIWVEGEPSETTVGGTGAGWNDPTGSIWTGMVDASVKNCMGMGVRWAQPPDQGDGAPWGATHSSWSDEFLWGPCA